MMIRDWIIFMLIYTTQLLREIRTQEIFNFSLNCNATSYENWGNFECKECGQNQIKLTESKGCKCSPNSIYVTRALAFYDCKNCSSNQISYPNSTVCVAAESQTCDPGSFHKFQTNEGEKNDPVKCVSCSADASPGLLNEQYGEICSPCLERETRKTGESGCSCSLNKIEGLCLTSDDYSSLSNKFSSFASGSRTSVIFESLVKTSVPSGTVTIDSSYFDCTIQRVTALCYLFKDQVSCSALANLCVLSLYNSQNSACRIYNTILEEKSVQFSTIDPLWKQDLPWIYYGSLSEQVIRSGSLTLTMAFIGNNTNTGNTVSKLPLYIIQYYLNGTIKSFTKLAGDLLFCPHSTYENDLSVTFGVAYKSSCSLNLTSYFGIGVETYTYELLIKDGDKYIDIPVAISNLKDSSNQRPNNNKIGPEGLTLTRRFVLVDRKTGVTGAKYCAAVDKMEPEVVTFLSSAMLIVEGQAGVSDKIYKPYVLLKYGQKRKEDLELETNTDYNYISVYQLDNSSFMLIMIVIFVIITLIGICVIISRVYIWRKYFPDGLPNIIPDRSSKLMSLTIYVIFQTLALCWFVFLAIVTSYWYIAFKWQDAVFTLLPSPSFYSSVYTPFYWLFWITFGLTFLCTFMMLYRQSVIDILLIDWEKERFFARRIDGIKSVRSVWRSLLIGNEYNELTTERFINFFFVVFGTAVFLLGFSWEQFAANTPYVSKYNPNIEINFPLKYFLNTFLVFTIGFVSYVIRRLLVRFIPSEVENFVDLCSVANISIFFFDSPFHGYYVHGKNPTEQSDGQLKDLIRGIIASSKDNSKGRGLDPQDSGELQTFEFYMTVELREQYNYVLAEAQELATGKKSRKRAAKNLKKSQAIKKLSKESEQKTILDKEISTLEKLEKKKAQLSRIFKRVIEDRMSSGSRIPDKTSSMNFFGMPPNEELDTLKTPQFFRDPLDGFKNTGMLGSDILLLVYDCMVLNAADLIFLNTSISLLMLAVFQGFAIWFRNKYGEDNISKKTLIDERFLI